MPKLLRARPPLDAKEERQVRKLAGSRHAPGDWIRRADGGPELGWPPNERDRGRAEVPSGDRPEATDPLHC